MGNVIVAQSGGPTTAINASLAGVVRGAIESQKYDKVYGALHGISGVFAENFMDMSDFDDEKLKLLYQTPSSYLGSCRYKMSQPEEDPATYEKLFEIFKKYDVAAFFYNGGNDSMDTIAKLAAYGKKVDSPIRFAGVPKTIDNDLVSIDHTPGFGSAAKYIASSMLEIAHDTAVYKVPCVTIVEIMGRDAGWLTASACLARNGYNPTPSLIYLPELPFHRHQFIEDLKKELEVRNDVVVAVSEGIRDENGIYISAKSAVADKFGHAQLSGAGKTLENLVKNELHIKCRSVELNILQRCAAHIASAQDLKESEELGRQAVRFTEEGNTGFMSSLRRTSDAPYTYEFEMGNLAEIANAIKEVPREWINEAGNDVTQEMVDYLKPLIQGEVPVAYKDGLPAYLPVDHLFHA